MSGLTIQQFVEKAVEGGWKADAIELRHWEQMMPNLHERDQARLVATMLLDPLAWKAVGKVKGWYEHQEIEWIIPDGNSERDAIIHVENMLGVVLRVKGGRIVYSPYKKGKNTARENMHRFIDALCDGHDITSSLAEATKEI